MIEQNAMNRCNGRRMSDDAARFRKHAFECRRLAKHANDDRDRKMLTEIADDLEAEAAKTEAVPDQLRS